MPTITLTLDEYEQLRQGRKLAEEQAAEARQKLAETQLASPDVKRLVDGLIAAREIIRIAIAYAGPDIIPITWPHAALEKFADVWETLPGATSSDHIDAAIDLRDLARHCREVAIARATEQAKIVQFHHD